jgi:hypothetical protein
METMLKSNGLWRYTKIVIRNPTDDQAKIVVDGKKDEVVGVIRTYISREIWFHLSGIDFPHRVWMKLKSLFDRVNESHIM